MNFELLEKAKDYAPNIPVLINMCSLRVKQLNQNFRPLVKPQPGDDTIDIVFREVIEGKLTAETDEEQLARRGFNR